MRSRGNCAALRLAPHSLGVISNKEKIMAKYKVMLRGENFEINFEDKIENMGFYATRMVKANSENEAEIKAIDLIRADSSLISMVKRDSQYSPKIYLEYLQAASWWERTGGKGYTFWPMDSE